MFYHRLAGTAVNQAETAQRLAAVGGSAGVLGS